MEVHKKVKVQVGYPDLRGSYSSAKGRVTPTHKTNATLLLP